VITYKKDSVLQQSLLVDVLLTMVNLTTTQVETLFGELEYIEQRLQVLGAIEAGGEATL
jgi:hypothetical protein